MINKKLTLGLTLHLMGLILGGCSNEIQFFPKPRTAQEAKGKALEDILIQTEKEINLTQEWIRATKEVTGDRIDEEQYSAKILKIALTIRGSKIKVLPGQEKWPQEVAQLNDFFSRENFKVATSSRINQVLDEKEGNCVGLSFLYLALGEQLKIPLFMVSLPGHFFVRYDDGRQKINIDGTAKGRSFSDQEFREKYRVPPENKFYLRNLTKKEAWGVLLEDQGTAQLQKGHGEEAIRFYDRSATLIPEYTELWNNRGVANLKLGKLTPAERDLLRARQLNPRSPEVFNNLGNVYLQQRKLLAAEENYGLAIKLNPSYAEAWNNRGVVYIRQERWPEAERNFKQSLKLDPLNERGWVNLGNIKAEKKEWGEASRCYQEALRLNPSLKEARNNQQAIYRFLNKK